jgi:hypothetical protein
LAYWFFREEQKRRVLDDEAKSKAAIEQSRISLAPVPDARVP